jgi:hypothetical protein
MLQLVEIDPNPNTEPCTGILQYTVELRKRGFWSWLGFGNKEYISVWAYSSAEAKVRAERYAPFDYIANRVYLLPSSYHTISTDGK